MSGVDEYIISGLALSVLGVLVGVFATGDLCRPVPNVKSNRFSRHLHKPILSVLLLVGVVMFLAGVNILIHPMSEAAGAHWSSTTNQLGTDRKSVV